MERGGMHGKLSRLVLAMVVGLLVSSAGAEIIFTTPGLDGPPIIDGDIFDIEWVGGDGESQLQLWHTNGDMWEILPIGEVVDDSVGQYAWDSTGQEGFHAFGAWVHTGDDQWYLAEPNGILEVLPPLSQDGLVSFTYPPVEGATARLGDTVDLTWQGGSAEAIVQLWVGSGSEWVQLDQVFALDNNSTYEWFLDEQIFGIGTYDVGAWIKPGDSNDWYEIRAAGALEILEPASDIPEPTSVGLVLAGGAMVLGRRRRRGETGV